MQISWHGLFLYFLHLKEKKNIYQVTIQFPKGVWGFGIQHGAKLLSTWTWFGLGMLNTPLGFGYIKIENGPRDRSEWSSSGMACFVESVLKLS